jgi:prepilin-type N-terminal cleavage/methylation domain-containing protein
MSLRNNKKREAAGSARILRACAINSQLNGHAGEGACAPSRFAPLNFNQSFMVRSESSRSGFTLLELLVSLVVLLIVITGSFSLFVNAVKISKSELTVSQQDQIVKTTLQLISTEIEQAGGNPDPKIRLPKLQSATTPGNNTIDVDRTEGLNIGNLITLDPTGGSPEILTITSVTRTNSNPTQPGSITVSPNVTGVHIPASAITTKNLPIKDGILYAPPVGRPAWSSDGSTLRIFGDLNDNGAFYYTEYQYIPGSGSTPGRITRASEMVTGATLPIPGGTAFKVPYTLLTNVLPNPNGEPLFSYVRDDQNNIVAVVITVTVQAETDNPEVAPRTTYRVTASSRNVVSASEISRSGENNSAALPAVPAYVQDLAKWPN